MNKKQLILILAIGITIASIATVSAGLFDSNDSNIKTHEFNYGNKATFNLSDNLTDKTGVETILFGQGVSYKYGDDYVCNLGGLVSYGGSDDVESKQNTAYYDEIKSEPTSQGYATYIFKYEDSEDYEVYVALDNMTIVEPDGYEEQYNYFWATFHSLDEAKVFVDTFKINEDVIK